jgi:hypothetical protein
MTYREAIHLVNEYAIITGDIYCIVLLNGTYHVAPKSRSRTETIVYTTR